MHAVQRVSVFEMLVQPQPLTPGFLANRTKDISQAVSAAIYSTLQKAEMLDSKGFLLQDPRYDSLLTQLLRVQSFLLMLKRQLLPKHELVVQTAVFACLLDSDLSFSCHL